jgi:hypothetical protein
MHKAFKFRIYQRKNRQHSLTRQLVVIKKKQLVLILD